jgi:UPF0755 protein
MKQSHKTRPVFFVLGIIFAIILCSFLWFLVFVAIVDLRSLDKDAVVYVQPGETVYQLSTELSHLDLIPNPDYFKYLVKLTGESHYLQAGYYRLTPIMSIKDLLNEIDRGIDEHYQLVIIPGNTVQDLFQQIKLTPIKLEYNNLRHLEGALYPDTYHYHNKHTLLKVLAKSHKQLNKYLLKSWQTRDKHLPYANPYKVLIMASILEKESSNYHDQQHITGVFINRLQKGMYLDSNATVRYAVQAKPGARLKHADFKTRSYYNTYRYKYLPPTPICFVSKQAIKAALHPLKTKDFYYLTTKNDNTIFSPTPIHMHSIGARHDSITK